MSEVLKLEVSAENQEQADAILNALLDKRLVTGGQFIETPARFRWKGEIVDMSYVTITSFTIAAHKEAIISVVEEASEEEVPMVSFIALETSKKLSDWIGQTVA